MVKRSRFARRHNGSHAASAQSDLPSSVLRGKLSLVISHATTIQAATKLDSREQGTSGLLASPQ